MQPKNDAIRIAIVDDHQIVIDGIKALLNSSDTFTILIDTTSPLTLLEALNTIEVDLLITDVMMPEMNGQTLAKKVKEKFPGLKILALSMSGEGEIINQMIDEADIAGYVLKNISKEELSRAIQKIAAGGIYFSDDVLKEMETSYSAKKEEPINLTIREVEIIRLMEKECSNKQIASTLFISERTVETHRKNIYRKTNKNSVLGLIKFAYDNKLLGR